MCEIHKIDIIDKQHNIYDDNYDDNYNDKYNDKYNEIKFNELILNFKAIHQFGYSDKLANGIITSNIVFNSEKEPIATTEIGKIMIITFINNYIDYLNKKSKIENGMARIDEYIISHGVKFVEKLNKTYSIMKKNIESKKKIIMLSLGWINN
jgi:hypothetical protein